MSREALTTGQSEQSTITEPPYRVQGDVVWGASTDGTKFVFDLIDLPIVQQYRWYACRYRERGIPYLTNSNGVMLHQLLMGFTQGKEVDHINLNTLDNRRCNLRICTHQQNQINQPVQKNNTSGVPGVSFYPPRKKFRARIKVSQHDIHLGYYLTFTEATQARNVGMELMFGEYGRYNDVPPAPDWIRKKVFDRCKRFVELSVGQAFSSF